MITRQWFINNTMLVFYQGSVVFVGIVVRTKPCQAVQLSCCVYSKGWLFNMFIICWQIIVYMNH